VLLQDRHLLLAELNLNEIGHLIVDKLRAGLARNRGLYIDIRSHKISAPSSRGDAALMNKTGLLGSHKTNGIKSLTC
jgi:hypothetical protein